MIVTIEHRVRRGRQQYYCPMHPKLGWMTGGSMWHHLRNRDEHGFDHVEASDLIHFTRTGKWPD